MTQGNSGTLKTSRMGNSSSKMGVKKEKVDNIILSDSPLVLMLKYQKDNENQT